MEFDAIGWVVMDDNHVRLLRRIAGWMNDIKAALIQDKTNPEEL
jgi:hypothetical protein